MDDVGVNAKCYKIIKPFRVYSFTHEIESASRLSFIGKFLLQLARSLPAQHRNRELRPICKL